MGLELASGYGRHLCALLPWGDPHERVPWHTSLPAVGGCQGS